MGLYFPACAYNFLSLILAVHIYETASTPTDSDSPFLLKQVLGKTLMCVIQKVLGAK